MAENAPITPLSNYIDQIRQKEVQAHADLIDENDFDKKFKSEYEKLVQMAISDNTLSENDKNEILKDIDKRVADNLNILKTEIAGLNAQENDELKSRLEEYNKQALEHLESFKEYPPALESSNIEPSITNTEPVDQLDATFLKNQTNGINDILNEPYESWKTTNEALAFVLGYSFLNEAQLIDFGKKIQAIIGMPKEDIDGKIGPKTMKKIAEFLGIKNTAQTAQPTEVKEKKSATEKTVEKENKTDKIPTIDPRIREEPIGNDGDKAEFGIKRIIDSNYNFNDEKTKPTEPVDTSTTDTMIFGEPLTDDKEAIKKAEDTKQNPDKTEPKTPEATKEDAEILAKVQDLFSKMQENLTPNFKISELFISKIDAEYIIKQAENKFNLQAEEVITKENVAKYLNGQLDSNTTQFITEVGQQFLNRLSVPININNPEEVSRLVDSMNQRITAVEADINKGKNQITEKGKEWTSKYFDYGSINPNNLNVTLSSNTEVVRKNEDRALNLSSDEYYKKNSPINLNDGLTPGYYPSEMTIDNSYPPRLIITDKVINSNSDNGGRRETRVFVFKKVQNTNSENSGA